MAIPAGGSATNPIHCGVIGNPIEHSQSPNIHLSFAKQFDLDLNYQKYLVDPADLKSFVVDFFNHGGTGLNVTLPFKQDLIKIVGNISDESKLCQSVNTLYLNNKNEICGDTTDGKGLLEDLKLKQFNITNKHILIIGAGGATTSILYALMQAGAIVTLHNRTLSKIEKIKNNFSIIGNIDIYSENNHQIYDGVITATSQFNSNLLSPLLKNTHTDTFIYDINYKERADETLNFFKDNGVNRCSDGYGMLIAQAAKSFEIWHGVLPKIN